jgi:hypothetical protein
MLGLLMEGIMNYAIEMGPGAMIYILSFIQIGFSHSTVNGGGGLCIQTHTHTHKDINVISKTDFFFLPTFLC